MNEKAVFEFAKDLEVKGRRPKYIADQVLKALPMVCMFTHIFQIMNIQTFGRWFFSPQGKEDFEKSQFSQKLRGLALGLTSTRDRAYGSRYLQMELPTYKEVLQKVCSAFEKVVDAEGENRPNEARAWEVQETLLLALQTLLPPMRGRPFWGQASF